MPGRSVVPALRVAGDDRALGHGLGAPADGRAEGQVGGLQRVLGLVLGQAARASGTSYRSLPSESTTRDGAAVEDPRAGAGVGAR